MAGTVENDLFPVDLRTLCHTFQQTQTSENCGVSVEFFGVIHTYKYIPPQTEFFEKLLVVRPCFIPGVQRFVGGQMEKQNSHILIEASFGTFGSPGDDGFGVIGFAAAEHDLQRNFAFDIFGAGIKSVSTLAVHIGTAQHIRVVPFVRIDGFDLQIKGETL